MICCVTAQPSPRRPCLGTGKMPRPTPSAVRQDNPVHVLHGCVHLSAHQSVSDVWQNKGYQGHATTIKDIKCQSSLKKRVGKAQHKEDSGLFAEPWRTCVKMPQKKREDGGRTPTFRCFGAINGPSLDAHTQAIPTNAF